MKVSVYTSCSINYLPKARVLAHSLKAHHPDAALTLCLNDIVPSWLDLGHEPFDQIWAPTDLGYERAWIFEHNVMELCTAVKGRALQRLMAQTDAEFLLYLDPDVLVLNPLDPIAEMMGDGSIGLVPHILCPEETDIGVRLTEMSVTEHGIYNLGHLIVRPDGNAAKFADWWAARLDAYCFDDRDRGLFTDQRWVDLAPAIFDGVKILRVPTLDVASWNLFGRTLRQERPGDPASFTVDGTPMLTYHFSGTGPNGAHRRVRGIFDAGNAATAEIERLYEDLIAAEGQAALADLACGYDHFDDGTAITAEARKLYRRHPDLRQAFADPYESAAGETSYQTWLRSKRPGVIDGLCLRPDRLNQAFDDLFDADYYLQTYPDAAQAVAAGQFASAMDHYCGIGSALMYDPNALFVSTWYADQAKYHDGHHLCRTCGTRKGTLLWHYLTVGLPHGFEPIEFFDSRWYLDRNPDLMRAFRLGLVSSPFAHFVANGSAEGRDPGPDFDAEKYAAAMPTGARLKAALRRSGPLAAALANGEIEGRALANGEG